MTIPLIRIDYLLQRYATNNCTKKELIEFFEWIDRQNDDTALRNAMQALWQNKNTSDVVPVIDKEKMYVRIAMQASRGLKSPKWGRRWVRLVITAGLQHYFHQSAPGNSSLLSIINVLYISINVLSVSGIYV